MNDGSTATYIIVRSTVTTVLGKGENKGDFNIFKKEGSIHLHQQTIKAKPVPKVAEGNLSLTRFAKHFYGGFNHLDVELKNLEEAVKRQNLEKSLSKQKMNDLCQKVDQLNDLIQDDEKKLSELQNLDEQNRLLDLEISKIQAEIQKEKDQQRAKLRESNSPTFLDKNFDDMLSLYTKLSQEKEDKANLYSDLSKQIFKKNEQSE